MREKIREMHLKTGFTCKYDIHLSERSIDQILSLFQSEMEKVIGENEDVGKEPFGDTRFYIKCKNQLRAEQRQKLKEIMEG